MRASTAFTASLALVSASFLACSSTPAPADHGTTSGTTTTPGTGGGTGTTSSTGGAGGATTTSVPYPAPHPGFPQITKHGGSVLHDPSLVTITFAGDELESQIQAFDDQIGTLSWWSTVFAGYGVGSAQNGGHVVIPDAPPANMSDADVQAWLAAKIGDGTLPPPSDQRIYMIYYPATTTVDLGGVGGLSCQGWLGYHDATTVLAGTESIAVSYAVMARCDNIDGLTETASHEIAEAVTDPNPTNAATEGYVIDVETAWTSLGGEVGDMCSAVSSVSEGGWALTRVWNNQAAAIGQQPCVPAPDSPVPFFDAAITKDLLYANPGDTVTTEVDCYSFGPLPSPIQLAARANSKSALQITFDKAECQNGDKVTMSIAVAPTAMHATNYHYTLEANLDANTGHLWRGMVHVK